MAYHQGTQSGFMLGGAITSDEIVPAGGITNSQSNLAAHCQPPEKPSSGANAGCVVGFILGVLIIVGIFALYPESDWFTARISIWIYILMGFAGIGLPILGYGIGDLAGADAEKKEQWEKEVERWRKKWICLACGKMWFQTFQFKARTLNNDGVS